MLVELRGKLPMVTLEMNWTSKFSAKVHPMNNCRSHHRLEGKAKHKKHLLLSFRGDTDIAGIWKRPSRLNGVWRSENSPFFKVTYSGSAPVHNFLLWNAVGPMRNKFNSEGIIFLLQEANRQSLHTTRLFSAMKRRLFQLKIPPKRMRQNCSSLQVN